MAIDGESAFLIDAISVWLNAPNWVVCTPVKLKIKGLKIIRKLERLNAGGNYVSCKLNPDNLPSFLHNVIFNNIYLCCFTPIYDETRIARIGMSQNCFVGHVKMLALTILRFCIALDDFTTSQ